ncbi:MAG: hypothetical protein QXQ30_01330 [Candidatus Pacearchaeota archaeon]
MKSKLILLFIVLLLPLVKSFSVESNVITNVVCPSSTIVIEEKVSADKSASYEAVVAGTASSFATILPSSFYLAQGQVRSFYLYITPSSNVLPGNYNILVTISNGYETKQIRHDIIVENCNKVIVTLESKEVCACESISAKARIKNNGLYKERYKIEISGEAARFAKLGTDLIQLNPDEEKDIIITFNPSCEDNEGEYSYTLKVSSLDSNALATQIGKIKVKNCFSYTILAEKNFYEICDGKKEIAKIYIENKGIDANFYEINFKAPNFANIELNRLSLNAKEKRNISIYLNPKFGEKEGEYDLEIETLSDKGKILAKEKIKVKIKECHKAEFKFLIDKEKDKICNGLVNEYKLKLENKGEIEGDYEIIAKAPEWIKLYNNSVKLKPNESAILNLEATPFLSTKPGEYNIEIIAKDKNSEVMAIAKLTLDTLTYIDCFKPELKIDKEKIEVEKDKTHVAVIGIENKGIKNARYFIEVSGNANRFTSVSPSTIEIEPGKGENIYLYIAPSLTTPTGNYTLILGIRLNETSIIVNRTVNVIVAEKIEIKEIEIEKVVEKEKPKEGIFQKIINFFKNLFKPKEKEENLTNEIEEISEILEAINTSNKTINKTK